MIVALMGLMMAAETRTSRLVASVRLAKGYTSTDAVLYLQRVKDVVGPLKLSQELQDKVYGIVSGSTSVLGTLRQGLLKLKYARDMTRLKSTVDGIVKQALKSFKRALSQTYPELQVDAFERFHKAASHCRVIMKTYRGEMINAVIEISNVLAHIGGLLQQIFETAADLLSEELGSVDLDCASLATFTRLRTSASEHACDVAAKKEHRCLSRIGLKIISGGTVGFKESELYSDSQNAWIVSHIEAARQMLFVSMANVALDQAYYRRVMTPVELERSRELFADSVFELDTAKARYKQSRDDYALAQIDSKWSTYSPVIHKVKQLLEIAGYHKQVELNESRLRRVVDERFKDLVEEVLKVS